MNQPNIVNFDLVPTPKVNYSFIDDHHRPPEKVLGDYIKIAYLSFFLLIGAPINIAAYFQMADGPKHTQPHIGITAINLLKKNLNYADLMILCGYVPSEVCWLLSYEWKGGDKVCKIAMFARMLAFQISSNLMVCIALNRCLSLLLPSTREVIRARWMTGIAWVLAIVISAPQLVVWRTVRPWSTHQWEQCGTIWEIGSELSNNSHSSSFFISQSTYNLVHLLLVYYIPLIMIVGCYGALLVALQGHKREVSRRHGVLIQLEEARDHTDGVHDEWETKSRTLLHLSTAQNKTINISLVLVGVYVVCWAPNNVLQAWKIADWQFYRDNLQNWDNLQGLMIFNSVINPFLYGMFGPLGRCVSNS